LALGSDSIISPFAQPNSGGGGGRQLHNQTACSSDISPFVSLLLPLIRPLLV
jgi:hypothetical protein